jgi:hypothetical protein
MRIHAIPDGTSPRTHTFSNDPSEKGIAVDDHDYDYDYDLRISDDVGLRDFRFGVTGLGLAAGLAILFAIIF